MTTTREYRTIMYSVRTDKEGKKVVDVHRFPFNANQKEGRAKLQKMVKRGFTFEDPRVAGGDGLPEVLVTDEVNLDKPEQVGAFCPECLAEGREVLQADCNFHGES